MPTITYNFRRWSALYCWKEKNGELVTKNNKNNCIYLSCTQAKRKGGLGAFDRVYVLPGGAFDRGSTKRGCDDRGRMPGHRFTQPSIPSGSVNEYRLRLGRYKAGMCDAAWCAPYTWAPLRWAVPTKGRYKSVRPLPLPLPLSAIVSSWFRTMAMKISVLCVISAFELSLM